MRACGAAASMNTHHLFLCDNTAVTLSFDGVRAKSWRLLVQIRRFASFAMSKLSELNLVRHAEIGLQTSSRTFRHQHKHELVICIPVTFFQMKRTQERRRWADKNTFGETIVFSHGPTPCHFTDQCDRPDRSCFIDEGSHVPLPYVAVAPNKCAQSVPILDENTESWDIRNK